MPVDKFYKGRRIRSPVPLPGGRLLIKYFPDRPGEKAATEVVNEEEYRRHKSESYRPPGGGRSESS